MSLEETEGKNQINISSCYLYKQQINGNNVFKFKGLFEPNEIHFNGHSVRIHKRGTGIKNSC